MLPWAPGLLASFLPLIPLRAPWHARQGVWNSLRWVWGTAQIPCGHRGPAVSDPVPSPCPCPKGAYWVIAPPLYHLPTHPTALCVRTWYEPHLAEQTELRKSGQGREISSPALEVGLPAQCSLAELRVSHTLSSLQQIQWPSGLSCLTVFKAFHLTFRW